MKYLLRLVLYLIVFFVTFSVASVALLRFVPVSFTPLKAIRLFELRENIGLSVDSKWMPLDKIAPTLPQAVISTEDGNFLRHRGFDFQAIETALKENREGKRVRGGSTISQQTAKNVFCTPRRTWFRKGLETWFTFWMELLWPKRRIMEVYLNVIETHAGVYGVEATARRFYGKPARAIDEYEAAMIATVLPSPLRMNLASPSPYMTRRSAQVRRLMSQTGKIEWDKPETEHRSQ